MQANRAVGMGRIWAILAVCGACPLAAGQATVTVDCTGASIGNSGSTPDIVRISTGTISPAVGYQFAFNPFCTGTGLFGGSVVGTNQPLMTVLNGLSIGSQRTLIGSMRNPAGTLPTHLDFEVVNQLVSGSQISMTFDQEILGDGRAQAAIRQISRPCCFLIGLNVISGGLAVRTWTPPAPVLSEWHFDGTLQSVKETGLAPSSGPSKIRYLDDPAFGPLLGGVGSEPTFPSSPTPTGVTQTQSAFGTTTSFGIPNIGSAVDTVYRTSPPRNAGAPTDTARSRGLGLSLWPNTRDFWPDERLGQWTIIADILVPQASWDAARANATGNNVCIPLVETSQNNNSAADAYVTVTGAAPGTPKVGNTPTYANAVPAGAGVAPNTWFRLAISNNLYGTTQSRVFINGAFVGTTGADWVYNACASLDRRWGNNSAQPAAGSAVPPASNATMIPDPTWAGWGEFPSPWAYNGVSSGTVPASAPGTASTFSLFADINGWGESVYVANLAFSDEAMSDASIGALGGPNARGIVYLTPAPCPVDFNGMDGVTVQDIFDFLNAWFAGAANANFNGVDGITVQDIFDFLNAWFAGC